MPHGALELDQMLFWGFALVWGRGRKKKKMSCCRAVSQCCLLEKRFKIPFWLTFGSFWLNVLILHEVKGLREQISVQEIFKTLKV